MITKENNYKCNICEDLGYTIEIEATCCHERQDYCCGIPIPIQVQVECICMQNLKI